MRQFFFAIGVVFCCQSIFAAEPVDIGDRRELFIDRHLIERTTGDAELQLQKPSPREVVLVTDKPWEGNTSAYYTIFQDGDRYRMYYRGSHFNEQTRKSGHPEVACYAESSDGIQWTKPELGICEFNGSKANNIVWTGVGTHNFTPCKDTNPDCPPEARYKALGRGHGGAKHGLYAFQSPDGLHWSLIRDEPVITKGAFDSQNLAFYDPLLGKYREFHRQFRGVRDIMACTSDDFLNWTEPEFLEYPGVGLEHLYTNAILPYDRAPHLLLGFPTRYLPDEGQRVEPTLMASRDGHSFHRWTEAIIPESAPEDRGGNRSNYMAWGMVQLPGEPDEYSMYATEAYYTGPDSRLRRFTYRVDGFVALHAGDSGGGLVTRPVMFRGNSLEINFCTHAQGQLRIELQDAAGQPIDGYRLENCPAIQGDAVSHIVRWSGGTDVGPLAGQPIRIRFELKNADVFSFRFQQ